jgi:hypothetical protein
LKNSGGAIESPPCSRHLDFSTALASSCSALQIATSPHLRQKRLLTACRGRASSVLQHCHVVASPDISGFHQPLDVLCACIAGARKISRILSTSSAFDNMWQHFCNILRSSGMFDGVGICCEAPTSLAKFVWGIASVGKSNHPYCQSPFLIRFVSLSSSGGLNFWVYWRCVQMESMTENILSSNQWSTYPHSPSSQLNRAEMGVDLVAGMVKLLFNTHVYIHQHFFVHSYTQSRDCIQLPISNTSSPDPSLALLSFIPLRPLLFQFFVFIYYFCLV